jgi:hypothetical protein
LIYRFIIGFPPWFQPQNGFNRKVLPNPKRAIGPNGRTLLDLLSGRPNGDDLPRCRPQGGGAGHTIGTHSQNHPLRLDKMPFIKAEQEIHEGIASVSAALGEPPAPFLRSTWHPRI